jgi:hypothetical protein
MGFEDILWINILRTGPVLQRGDFGKGIVVCGAKGQGNVWQVVTKKNHPPNEGRFCIFSSQNWVV